MSFILINGSPRKSMSCGELINAVSKELTQNKKDFKIYNLYDLEFKGCHSCFACKRVGKKSYGECTIKDDLFEILQEIDDAEGVILASPIYFQDIAGVMRSFLERVLFRKFMYTNPPHSIVEKEKNFGIIYTMNVSEEAHNGSFQKDVLENLENKIKFIYKNVKPFYAFDTNQMKNYDGLDYTYFNTETKLKRHQENFPKEIERVREYTREFF